MVEECRREESETYAGTCAASEEGDTAARRGAKHGNMVT